LPVGKIHRKKLLRQKINIAMIAAQFFVEFADWQGGLDGQLQIRTVA
jgi:hypothetical protein